MPRRERERGYRPLESPGENRKYLAVQHKQGKQGFVRRVTTNQSGFLNLAKFRHT